MDRLEVSKRAHQGCNNEREAPERHMSHEKLQQPKTDPTFKHTVTVFLESVPLRT